MKTQMNTTYRLTSSRLTSSRLTSSRLTSSLLTGMLAIALTACSSGSPDPTSTTSAQAESDSSTSTGGSTSTANLTVIAGTTSIAPGGSTPLAIAGGVSPYTTTLSNSSVGTLTGNVFYANNIDGSVVVTVTDANGSIATTTLYVKTNLILTASVNPVRAGELSELSAAGGLAPYTFSATKATIEDDNQFRAPDTSGSYIVTVSDKNGKTKSLTIKVTSADALVVSPASSTIHADSGVTTFQITGGTAPYKARMYSGDGTVSVSNNTQVNYTAPSAAGTARIIVTDADGSMQNIDLTIENSVVRDQCSLIAAQGFSNNVERGTLKNLNSKAVCQVAMPATSNGKLWTQSTDDLKCPEGWNPMMGPNGPYTISFAQIVLDYTSYWGASNTLVTKSHNSFSSIAPGTECVQYCTGKNILGKCKSTQTACAVTRYLACVPDYTNPLFQ